MDFNNYFVENTQGEIKTLVVDLVLYSIRNPFRAFQFRRFARQHFETSVYEKCPGMFVRRRPGRPGEKLQYFILFTDPEVAASCNILMRSSYMDLL